MAKTFQDSVSYVGDVRIIGVIVNKQGGSIIGYVLYLEQKGTVEFISLNLLANFASVLKPSNFILSSDGSVTCTECALNRLPEYIVVNNQLTPINIRNIYVLGEIRTNGRLTSYRVISGTGKVVDLTLQEVVDYTKQGVELVNVHLSSSSKALVPNKEDKFVKIERKQVTSEKKIPATVKDGYNFYGNSIKDKNKATYLKKLVPNKIHPYKLSGIAPRGSYALGCTDKSLISRADFDFLYKFLKKVYKTEVYTFCSSDEERKYFKKFFDIAFDKENWILKNRNFNDGKHKLKETGEINEKAGWCFCLMSQFMLKAYSRTIIIHSSELKSLIDLNIPIYFVDNISCSEINYGNFTNTDEVSFDDYSLILNNTLILTERNKVKKEYGRKFKSLIRPNIDMNKPSYLTGFSFDTNKTSVRDTIVINDTIKSRYSSDEYIYYYPCTRIYNFYQMFDKGIVAQVDDLCESLGDIMCAYQLLKLPKDVGYITRVLFSKGLDINDSEEMQTLNKVGTVFATLLLTYNKPLFDFISTQVDLSKYSYKPLDLAFSKFLVSPEVRNKYGDRAWYRKANMEDNLDRGQLRSWYESGLRYFRIEDKFYSVRFSDIYKILILVFNYDFIKDYGVSKSIYNRCSILSSYKTDKKPKAGTIVSQVKG